MNLPLGWVQRITNNKVEFVKADKIKNTIEEVFHEEGLFGIPSLLKEIEEGGKEETPIENTRKKRKRNKKQFFLPRTQPEILQTEWNLKTVNPHNEQYFQTNENDELLPIATSFERILKDDAPRAAYRRRGNEIKSTIHWGQRKLLLSEIEFLTKFAQPNFYVVYAGAAPGIHIPLLAELFKSLNLQFHLFDPSPFSIKSSENIKVTTSYFTNEIASSYCSSPYLNNTLFISDIRTANIAKHSQLEVETRVINDHEMQKLWCKLIKPVKCMLKFRLPYSGNVEIPNMFPYLKGDIYLPIWGPQTTTETRLVCDYEEDEIYDSLKYEEQLFYFNTVTRVLAYSHPVKDKHIDGEGLDHCYDCRAEIDVLGKFLNRFPPVTFNIKSLEETDSVDCLDSLAYEISNLSRTISAHLSSERTLLTPTPRDRGLHFKSIF